MAWPRLCEQVMRCGGHVRWRGHLHRRGHHLRHHSGRDVCDNPSCHRRRPTRLDTGIGLSCCRTRASCVHRQGQADGHRGVRCDSKRTTPVGSQEQVFGRDSQSGLQKIALPHYQRPSRPDHGQRSSKAQPGKPGDATPPRVDRCLAEQAGPRHQRLCCAGFKRIQIRQRSASRPGTCRCST